MNLTLIKGKSTRIIDYKDQRVLTTKQIAEFYETDPIAITKNFNNNKEKYLHGKHYFKLEHSLLRDFKNNIQNWDVVESGAKVLYLWTERGALLHAKSLNTEKAWELFEYLSDVYFRVREKVSIPDTVKTITDSFLDRFIFFVNFNNVYFCEPTSTFYDDHLLFIHNGKYRCNRIQLLLQTVRIIPNTKYFEQEFVNYGDIKIVGKLTGRIDNVSPDLIGYIQKHKNYVEHNTIDITEMFKEQDKKESNLTNKQLLNLLENNIEVSNNFLKMLTK